MLLFGVAISHAQTAHALEGFMVRVTADNAPIRDRKEVIATVRKGTQLWASEVKNGDWALVRALDEGKRGWLHRRHYQPVVLESTAYDRVRRIQQRLNNVDELFDSIDPEDDIAWVKQACSQLEQILGSSHPVIATAMLQLGRLELAQRSLVEAEKHLLRARRIVDSHVGPSHVAVAEINLTLGEVFQALNKSFEAYNCFVESYRTLLSADPEYKTINQYGARRLGIVLARKGLFDTPKTVQQQNETIELIEAELSTVPSPSKQALQLMELLAEMDVTNSEYAYRDDRLLALLDMQKKVLGETSHEVGETLTSLAEGAYFRNQPVLARQYLNDSLEVLATGTASYLDKETLQLEQILQATDLADDFKTARILLERWEAMGRTNDLFGRWKRKGQLEKWWRPNESAHLLRMHISYAELMILGHKRMWAVLDEDYQLAIEISHQALEIAKRSNSDRPDSWEYQVGPLAGCYALNEEPDKAIKVFQNYIAVLDRHYGPASQEAVEALIALVKYAATSERRRLSEELLNKTEKRMYLLIQASEAKDAWWNSALARRLVKLFPTDAAGIARGNRLLDLAIERYLASGRKNFNGEPLAANLCSELRYLNRRDRARSFLEEVVQHHRDIGTIYQSIGLRRLQEYVRLMAEIGDLAPLESVAREVDEQADAIIDEGDLARVQQLGVLSNALERALPSFSATSHLRRSRDLIAGELSHYQADLVNANSRYFDSLVKSGRYDKALAEMHSERVAIHEGLREALPAMPMGELVRYVSQSSDRLGTSSVWRAIQLRDHPGAADLSAEWLLNLKSRTMLLSALASRSKSNDANRLKRNELRSEAAALTRKQPTAAYRSRLDQLYSEIDSLSVPATDNVSSARLPDSWLTLDELRSRMTPGSLLINYMLMNRERHDPNHAMSYDYVAWIVPAAGEGDVQIVPLADAKKVDALIVRCRKEIANGIGHHPNSQPRALEKSLTELSDAILLPVLDAAQAANLKQLLISPDGGLWRLPLAALPTRDGAPLISEYVITFTPSGRLSEPPEQIGLSLHPPTAFGDPDFDLLDGENAQMISPASLATVSRRSVNELRRVERLPGAKQEILAIKPFLAVLSDREPVTLLGSDASEQSIKEIAKPQVLLMSTHAFFLDRTSAFKGRRAGVGPVDRTTRFENPLLRCGLLLAGANHADKAPIGLEDGILTGLEIIDLDLKGTELVVLSACDTGLGDISNGEGVAGLRQAFELAGAESVVSTLWQIPDNETASLMTMFFQRLSERKTKSEALRQAQLDQINILRDRYGYAHPYYWAAFTFTGADRPIRSFTESPDAKANTNSP